MKALVATIFAAGVSLATLSSAQAFTVTAAPLAEAAKQTSSVVEVQGNVAGGCERGYMMTPQGCRGISWNYKKSAGKKKRKNKKKYLPLFAEIEGIRTALATRSSVVLF